jgi:two-component system sensor histidine kinase QseC
LKEEVFERLGERFYRALGTKTQGSGLGLSICRKIIELHHSKIVFSPSEYGGLKVSIQLNTV